MAINKGVLAKEVNGIVEYIYPKTTADMVDYTENQTVKDKLDSLTAKDNAIGTRIDNLVVAAGGSDIIEVVDARQAFTDNKIKASLKARLEADFSSLSGEIESLAHDKLPDAIAREVIAEYIEENGLDGSIEDIIVRYTAGMYSKPSDGIPASDLTQDVQTSLDKANTALQIAPVKSVNNKTGDVVLDASDIHALPDNTVIPDGLPAVTTADNGKFMRVVSGVWKAQVLTNVSEVGA